MANKENRPPALATSFVSGLSPSNKPALNRQRDHSACRRPETPLKVRKTRENLKQQSLYTDIPPPCVHGNHEGHHSCAGHALPVLLLKEPSQASIPASFDENGRPAESTASATLPVVPKMQREKSVSRRMLSKVKQGISGRSKIAQAIRPMESETSLVRRISGRLKQSSEAERRSQSFDIARMSTESGIDETPDSASFESASVQRSVTASTISTADILGESQDPATPNSGPQSTNHAAESLSAPTSSPASPPPTSPSSHPTPRPLLGRNPPALLPQPAVELALIIPCVDLYVTMDVATVDVHSKRDIWVAVEATVRSMTSRVRSSTTPDQGADFTVSSKYPNYLYSTAGLNGSSTSHPAPQATLGGITTLRLCFKPVEGCLIREVIGQKYVKDPVIGQQCSLFIKLRVPKIRMRDSSMDPDQDSLLMELESIMGTLKTEILHVEARYRHSMLPLDNVVTVRHVCKITRPKTESRWSIANLINDLEVPNEVHAMLARYVASHYPSETAIELLQRYLSSDAIGEPGVREIYDSLVIDLESQSAKADMKPSVIVTDIDLDSMESQVPFSDHSSTISDARTPSAGSHSLSSTSISGLESKPHSSTSPSMAPSILSAPKTTTALITNISSTSHTEPLDVHPTTESQDSARQLWRHIRRSSLSAKQLAEFTAGRVEHLEANDDHLKELRRRAIANKRSIGAETLRAWKWDETMQNRGRQSEAPWM